MKKAIWIYLLSVVGVMVVGCGGGGQPPAGEKSSAPAASAAGASSASIGVPECDEYLNKVQACIDNHVPEDSRAMQRQSMDQIRDQWRQAAANPTAKAGLAAGCKAALETARASFASYGCEW